MFLHRLKNYIVSRAKKISDANGTTYYSIFCGAVKGRRIFSPERLDLIILGFNIKVNLAKIRSFTSILDSKKTRSEASNEILAQLITASSPQKTIIIYKHHIGEIFVFLNCLSEFLSKNNINKVALVVLDVRYKELFESYAKTCGKDIKIVVFPQPAETIDKVISHEITIKGDIQIITPTPDRFCELRERIMLKSETNFSQYIANSLRLAECTKVHTPIFSKELVDSAERKAREINLNLENFVFLFPAATTASGLRDSFWIEIGDKLQAQGKDVLINPYPIRNWYQRYKHADLSIMEALYLATKCKACIALVSGLIVCTAEMKVKRIVLYTQQTQTVGYQMSAEDMLRAYSIGKISGACCDNLYEINADSIYEKQLIEKIISLVE